MYNIPKGYYETTLFAFSVNSVGLALRLTDNPKIVEITRNQTVGRLELVESVIPGFQNWMWVRGEKEFAVEYGCLLPNEIRRHLDQHGVPSYNDKEETCVGAGV